VKFLASKEASDWLSQKLTEQRGRVEAAEAAMQQYREQTDAVSLDDGQNIVVQKLTDLNAAVTRAKTERMQKESHYNQIERIRANRAALDSLPQILGDQFIQEQKAQIAALQQQQVQLSGKLGPRHPDMVKLSLALQTAEAKLQGEIGKVIDSIKSDYLAAKAQEETMSRALEQQKQEALALNRKAIEYSALQRDAASTQQVFDALMQRTKETGISGELKTSNIRVVDPAEVPRSPVVPDVRGGLTRAVEFGLFGAIAVCFLIDGLDSRINTPDDLAEHLNLRYLGLVPAIFEKTPKDPLITNAAQPGFVEAFRTLGTNIVLSSGDTGARSLVVASTGPGEGKTLVASNIAIALAQVGHRVLVLDADLRRPRLHDVFGVAQAPGLSDALDGTSKLSDALNRTSVPNLWVLPAGVRNPQPVELFGSSRFRQLLVFLKPHFDWIIIDTPPVMPVTDAVVAAHVAAAVLFVVGSDMVSRFAAQRALKQLHLTKAQVLGAVLNRVDLKHQALYYSADYRRRYSAYYENAS
jgi:polysaccharide biosynthesis transport protein